MAASALGPSGSQMPKGSNTVREMWLQTPSAVTTEAMGLNERIAGICSAQA